MRDQRKQASEIEKLLGEKPKRSRLPGATYDHLRYESINAWAGSEPELARADREARIREIDALLMGATAPAVKNKAWKARDKNRRQQRQLTERQEKALRAEKRRLLSEMPRGFAVVSSFRHREAFVAVLRAAWPEYLTTRQLCERSGAPNGSVKNWLVTWRTKGWLEREAVGEDQLYPGAPVKPLWGYRLRPEADASARRGAVDFLE